MSDKLDLSGPRARVARLSRHSGQEAAPRQRKHPERVRWALQFGPGPDYEREVALDAETLNLSHFKSPEFEFLGDGPPRDEADSKSGLNGGLDSLRRIEIHDTLKRPEFDTGLCESRFDDAASPGTLFAHQKT